MTNLKTETHTLAELKNRAADAALERLKTGVFNVHACSICGFRCHYLQRDGRTLYNSGCYCTDRESIQLGSSDDVRNLIDMQSNEKLLEHVAAGGDFLDYKKKD